VEPFEDAEDPLPVLRRNADAVVLDPKSNPADAEIGPQDHLGVHSGGDEFYGVGKKVPDDLAQKDGVGADPRKRSFEPDIRPGLTEFRRHLGEESGEKRSQGDLLEPEARPADPRILKEILDEGVELRGSFRDPREVAAPLRIQPGRVLFLEHLPEPAHRPKGSAQVVRDAVGERLEFPQGRAQLLCALFDFAFELRVQAQEPIFRLPEKPRLLACFPDEGRVLERQCDPVGQVLREAHVLRVVVGFRGQKRQGAQYPVLDAQRSRQERSRTEAPERLDFGGRDAGFR
jgi:hypothetical protein